MATKLVTEAALQGAASSIKQFMDDELAQKLGLEGSATYLPVSAVLTAAPSILQNSAAGAGSVVFYNGNFYFKTSDNKVYANWGDRDQYCKGITNEPRTDRIFVRDGELYVYVSGNSLTAITDIAGKANAALASAKTYADGIKTTILGGAASDVDTLAEVGAIAKAALTTTTGDNRYLKKADYTFMTAAEAEAVVTSIFTAD